MKRLYVKPKLEGDNVRVETIGPYEYIIYYKPPQPIEYINMVIELWKEDK